MWIKMLLFSSWKNWVDAEEEYKSAKCTGTSDKYFNHNCSSILIIIRKSGKDEDEFDKPIFKNIFRAKYRNWDHFIQIPFFS